MKLDKIKETASENGKQSVYSRCVKICGIGEDKVRKLISDMEEGGGAKVEISSVVGEVHILVSTMAEDKKAARKVIKPVVGELKEIFGNYIYSTEENVTLEQAVVDLLLANNLTVSCAESCTGGMLSARLINVPGVSEVYKYGYITYSNKSKRKILGVRRSVIDKYGVISAETAKDMAKGLAAITKADICVSVTGNAGPDAAEDKPVGLVYIGCCIKGKVAVTEAHFTGERNEIREAATAAALAFMRNNMLEYYSRVTFGSDEE
ncbi:MAG: nicotinamide-nucleotide amidohydrolase family protein [Lachnospiraceae bacterium]|nr:nicotinamide-nucleotide amidohydrolase family protein [Lachnospiraceae bacterium]